MAELTSMMNIGREMAGRIDESGFHRLSKAFVETGHVSGQGGLLHEFPAEI